MTLIFYLFVAIFILVLANYHIVYALLDGKMSYINNIPEAERSVDGWKIRYFIPHLIISAISIVLLVVAYMYNKKGRESGLWRALYQVASMIVIVIATLIIYSISTQPVDPLIP